MNFDLATLKIRIGVTDTSKDVNLTFAMELVIALLEDYLDRKLSKADDTEKFIHFAASVVSLHRYPLHSIASISGSNEKFHWSEVTGLVHFDHHVTAHELTVVYNGGFETLPQDLIFAALQLFDAIWDDVDGGSSSSVAAGSISRITLQDVGTVSYATGNSNAGGSLLQSAGVIPATVMGIIDSYRRVLC